MWHHSSPYRRLRWLALLSALTLVGMAVVSRRAQGSPPPTLDPTFLAGKPSSGPVDSASEGKRGRGYVPANIDLSHLQGKWRPASRRATSLSSWDWRAQGMVTRVQDQGVCGSCYAFAALASFESGLLVDGQGLYDFSENNVIECNYEETGCAGGHMWIVTNRLSDPGAVLEACDPYNQTNQPCNTGCPLIKTVTDMWVLAGDSAPDTATLKNWLQNYGPLYVSMDSGSSSGAWEDEFSDYNGSYTMYYPVGVPDLDHAVLLVGWDDGLPHAGGTGAWIVKNSWGTSWGGTCGYGTEGGYFTIAYGSAGIGSDASFVQNWQDYDPQGHLLYHDEAGLKGEVGWGALDGYGLARLIPTENGCASQVEIWTTDATTDVDVWIYNSFDGSAPSGLLWQGQNLAFDYAGYHSIPIQPPLPVFIGDDVNVMVKFGNASKMYPLAYDDTGPAAPNQSFASATGLDGDWLDVGDDYTVDLGIRLRTGLCQATSTPTPSPTHTSTPSPTHTATPTTSPTPTSTPSPTYTVTPTPSPTHSATPSPTTTFTATPTPTQSATPSPSPTETATFTPSLTPSATPSPTLTATPSATPTQPTQTPTPTGDVVAPSQLWIPLSLSEHQGAHASATATATSAVPTYSDDFGDSGSGWPVGDNSDYRTHYLDGEYRVLVKRPYCWAMASPQVACASCSVEVDAHHASSAYGAYGIMLSVGGGRDGHLFLVTGDQLYSLYTQVGGLWYPLVDWTESSYLSPGQGLNHLCLTRQGSEVRLFANGHYLAATTDPALAGELVVGVVGAAYETPSVDTRFDDFAIYS